MGVALALTPPPPPRGPPSDLALRNCLLTSDLTVRIGDYGLAHSNYKVGLPSAGRGGVGGTGPPDLSPPRRITT